VVPIDAMPTSEALRAFDDPEAFESIDVTTNGIRLRVRVAGPKESRRLALCLHGFPESSYSWRYQMKLLADLGYRVWAPDLRGYGKSDKPRRVADYRMDELVQDVAGLIDAAKADEVVLIAHDWGGAVAWDFVLRRLRKVDRFVVMNLPHPRRLAEHLFRIGPQLRRSWYMFFFQLPFVPERYLARDGHRAIAAAFRGMAVDKSRFPPAVLKVYQDSAAEPGALFGMLAYYRAAFRYRPKARHPKLKTPTLMIWGEEDTALGKELTYRTDELVEDLTIRYLPRVSHWVQQEAPETVNAILAAWLKGERVPEAGEVGGAV
jgi:pimeloyl-ACP methyl ester carboxylesterase